METYLKVKQYKLNSILINKNEFNNLLKNSDIFYNLIKNKIIFKKLILNNLILININSKIEIEYVNFDINELNLLLFNFEFKKLLKLLNINKKYNNLDFGEFYFEFINKNINFEYNNFNFKIILNNLNERFNKF